MTSKEALETLRQNTNKRFKKYMAWKGGTLFDECCKPIIKDLEDFEWLKNKIGLKVLDSLPTHDKFELLRILGIDMSEWEN